VRLQGGGLEGSCWRNSKDVDVETVLATSCCAAKCRRAGTRAAGVVLHRQDHESLIYIQCYQARKERIFAPANGLRNHESDVRQGQEFRPADVSTVKIERIRMIERGWVQRPPNRDARFRTCKSIIAVPKRGGHRAANVDSRGPQRHSHLPYIREGAVLIS